MAAFAGRVVLRDDEAAARNPAGGRVAVLEEAVMERSNTR
jgi:hypothetical protein